MSIASELNRIIKAKNNLIQSLNQAGIVLSAGTKIDNLSAVVVNEVMPNVEVSKINPSIDTNFTHDEGTVIIDILMPYDVNGTIISGNVKDSGVVVEFSYGSSCTMYYTNITNGSGRTEIKNCSTGTYNITSTFLGNRNYGLVRKEDEIHIPSMTASFTNINTGKSETIRVTVPRDSSGNVVCNLWLSGSSALTLIEENINASIINGMARIVTQTLNTQGKYVASIKYLGDSYWLQSNTITGSFQVTVKTI